MNEFVPLMITNTVLRVGDDATREKLYFDFAEPTNKTLSGFCMNQLKYFQGKAFSTPH